MSCFPKPISLRPFDSQYKQHFRGSVFGLKYSNLLLGEEIFRFLLFCFLKASLSSSIWNESALLPPVNLLEFSQSALRQPLPKLSSFTNSTRGKSLHCTHAHGPPEGTAVFLTAPRLLSAACGTLAVSTVQHLHAAQGQPSRVLVCPFRLGVRMDASCMSDI